MVKSPAVAALLSLAALGAQAGSIEDAFKAYLDKLKSSGKAQSLGLVDPRAPEVTAPQLDRRVDALPLGKGRYVIFTAKGCRSCAAAVERLQKHVGGTAEVLDVSTSTTAREAFALTKAKGVPAMLMDGYLLTGYTPQAFERAVITMGQDDMQKQRGEGA